MLVWWTLVVAVGLNLLLFLPAYFRGTDTLTDVSYALTFVVLALMGGYVSGWTGPALVVVAMVLAWALRLGIFLGIRIRKMGRDRRFDGMRESFLRFGSFWLLQGFTVWMVMLAATLFFGHGATQVSVWAWLGVIVWLVGIAVETVADWQKQQFIADPSHKGQWIESGLWRYSRHPNYFGEIVIWSGLYLFVVSGLEGVGVWSGLLSPLYIAFLLLFVSGIPPSEKSADVRWGDNPHYQAYKRRTSVLVPWLPKS